MSIGTSDIWLNMVITVHEEGAIWLAVSINTRLVFVFFSFSPPCYALTGVSLDQPELEEGTRPSLSGVQTFMLYLGVWRSRIHRLYTISKPKRFGPL